MARFIEKNDAQLMKNSRNMVPSTLTALRSVCTDFNVLAPRLTSPESSASKLSPSPAVDRRRNEDIRKPAARRTDDP